MALKRIAGELAELAGIKREREEPPPPPPVTTAAKKPAMSPFVWPKEDERLCYLKYDVAAGVKEVERAAAAEDAAAAAAEDAAEAEEEPECYLGYAIAVCFPSAKLREVCEALATMQKELPEFFKDGHTYVPPFYTGAPLDVAGAGDEQMAVVEAAVEALDCGDVTVSKKGSDVELRLEYDGRGYWTVDGDYSGPYNKKLWVEYLLQAVAPHAYDTEFYVNWGGGGKWPEQVEVGRIADGRFTETEPQDSDRDDDDNESDSDDDDDDDDAGAETGRFCTITACKEDVDFAHQRGYWDTRKHTVHVHAGDTLVLYCSKAGGCARDTEGLYSGRFFELGTITGAEKLTPATRVVWPSAGHAHRTDQREAYMNRISFTPAAGVVVARDEDAVTAVPRWGVKAMCNNLLLQQHAAGAL